MKPLNDLAKVSLGKSDEYGFGANDKSAFESGVLVELPDNFDYFGMWSFAFESSFMNEKALKTLLDRWRKHIGHRVFWTALSEKGNVVDIGGEKFAFVKLTSLIAYSEETDLEVLNAHTIGGGSFNMADGIE